MNSVGETLRRARVQQGLDLAEVAARTKINSNYLTAIESDDRQSLPGSFFYRSFVHQYARALSLNTQQIDAELDRVLGAEAPPPLPGQDGNPIRQREPEIQVRESFFERLPLVRSLAILLIAGLGCSAVYAWWIKAAHAKSIASPAVPAQTISLPAAPARENPKPAPAAQLRPASPAEVPPRAQSPAPPAVEHVVLEFLAKEETWLEVLSDGKRVFSGVLQPNESRSVEGKQVARLTVGNAAGLEIRLNGRAIGPIGPHGRVRTVVFKRDNYQIVAKDGV